MALYEDIGGGDIDWSIKKRKKKGDIDWFVGMGVSGWKILGHQSFGELWENWFDS